MRAERGLKGSWVDDAVACGGEIGDLDPALFEGFGGVEHGVVFDLRGDEVCGLLSVEIRLQDAGEREVVALRAAGGEDDLLGRAVQ